MKCVRGCKYVDVLTRLGDVWRNRDRLIVCY
jgi:hypothetical protein